MRLPLVSPAAIAELARSAVGQVVETAAAVATVPVRVMGLLGQTELLVNRVTMIADEAEGLVRRVSAVVETAEATVAEARAIATAASGVVGRAGEISARADQVVGQATEVSARAEKVVAQATEVSTRAELVVGQADATSAEAVRLLAAYSGALLKGAPIVHRFVDELSPEEVTAAIRMIDQLPALRAHLVDDVMPLLGKLDQVGPDLHKLLEVTEDLHLAISGLPGLKMFKRRGEERIEEAR